MWWSEMKSCSGSLTEFVKGTRGNWPRTPFCNRAGHGHKNSHSRNPLIGILANLAIRGTWNVIRTTDDTKHSDLKHTSSTTPSSWYSQTTCGRFRDFGQSRHVLAIRSLRMGSSKKTLVLPVIKPQFSIAPASKSLAYRSWTNEKNKSRTSLKRTV